MGFVTIGRSWRGKTEARRGEAGTSCGHYNTATSPCPRKWTGWRWWGVKWGCKPGLSNGWQYYWPHRGETNISWTQWTSSWPAQGKTSVDIRTLGRQTKVFRVLFPSFCWRWKQNLASKMWFYLWFSQCILPKEIILHNYVCSEVSPLCHGTLNFGTLYPFTALSDIQIRTSKYQID